ncbi:hypothetical protein GCM10007872_08680 [Gluconobacter sphaericus NBRC 12467]|uniref:Uncharacterized protein n=1 Tax=Gluconobacter sphaericus NBRC 12467 TaxID=1307951 RepID=A0AA37W9H7_9PROT|nr:hypothetical protein GSP01_25030 [Gluconobacter sphaericus NBRC 12467]GLQ83960.1 hypothetical protein GCM10007872_08680 [Gluconobacter sphaericus NBRC 12467]
MQGQRLLPERQSDRLWPSLRETFQLTQVCNYSEARGRLTGETEYPLFVLERKIADVSTRLKYVSSDVNVLNWQDWGNDQPVSVVILASAVMRCTFQR